MKKDLYTKQLEYAKEVLDNCKKKNPDITETTFEFIGDARAGNQKNKKMFIAYGNRYRKFEYGIEVHLIYANDIEEAMNICPIPKEKATIMEIHHKTQSGIEPICSYYE